MPIILIDGREVDKKRGIGHFTRELLFHLSQLQPTLPFRFVCIVPREQAAKYASLLPNIRFIMGSGLIGAVLWEQILVPVTARSLNAAFVICPNNTYPLVTLGQTRRIIVLHDLIFLHWWRIAGPLKLKVGNLYRSLVIRWIRQSDLFITVSQHSAKLIWRHLCVRATVCPNSCDHLRSILVGARPYPHTKRYLLHIGGDASTKNTLRVIEAFMAARTRLGSAAPDLIVLGTSPQFAAKNFSGYGGVGIKPLHGVADEVKCSLLIGAVAVLFPSLKEGFGLPIIEAHAAGKTVITSNRHPMVDLVQPGDRVVDPLSVSSIADAIVNVCFASQTPENLPPPIATSQTKGVLSSFFQNLARDIEETS
nr:glycosyltransferase family 1 protein [Pleomorphomonas sp. NRK KF1]